MLCDEVGLGKTIEAGLVIRQLLISGRVKRCLILAPKSVLNQWQEELYEKFALDVPRYEDGSVFWMSTTGRAAGQRTRTRGTTCDVLLAGSQLAKRERPAQSRSWRPGLGPGGGGRGASRPAQGLPATALSPQPAAGACSTS